MIIVILADPASGQAQIIPEANVPPQVVHEILYTMTDHLGKQIGKPPLPKQSGLVVPPPGTTLKPEVGGQQ